MVDGASLKLAVADVSKVDRELMCFGNNALKA